MSWEPLDMEGTFPTMEETAKDCQERCNKQSGCYHFSFWSKGKENYCHLQDAFALRRDYQANFVSGPFQCWSYLHDSGLVEVGVEQFLPKQFNCMQVGVSWEPVMQWRSGRVLPGSQKDQIVGCQSLCSRTTGCGHFTMEVSTRTCKLSGEDATPLPGVFNSISGPPACTDDTRTFMRKFSQGEVESSRSCLVGVGVAALGLVVVGAAVLYVRRPKKEYTTRDLLVDGMEE